VLLLWALHKFRIIISYLTFSITWGSIQPFCCMLPLLGGGMFLH